MKVLVTRFPAFGRPPALADAVLAAGVNILVTRTVTTSPESLGFAPARTRAVSFVPIGRLLDGVRAVVAVGGSGTTSATLSHGLPLAFLPRFANQPVIADAVSAFGAGVVSLLVMHVVDVALCVSLLTSVPRIGTACGGPGRDEWVATRGGV